DIGSAAGSYSLIIGTGSSISGTGGYTVPSGTPLSGGRIQGPPTLNVPTGAVTFDDTVSAGSTVTLNVSSGANLVIGTTISSGTVILEGSGTTNDTSNINAATAIVVEGNITAVSTANILHTPIVIKDSATLILSGQVNNLTSV